MEGGGRGGGTGCDFVKPRMMNAIFDGLPVRICGRDLMAINSNPLIDGDEK